MWENIDIDKHNCDPSLNSFNFYVDVVCDMITKPLSSRSSDTFALHYAIPMLQALGFLHDMTWHEKSFNTTIHGPSHSNLNSWVEFRLERNWLGRMILDYDVSNNEGQNKLKWILDNQGWKRIAEEDIRVST